MRDQFVARERSGLRRNRRRQPDRTTQDERARDDFAACDASLQMAVAAKQMLKIIVGAGQAEHRVTMKEAGPVATCDLEKMCDRRLQRTGRTLPSLHRPQETSQAATHLHGTELGWILQDRSRRLHPSIGALHRLP